MIPMVDLRAQHAEVSEEVEAHLRSAMASGQFVLGPNVEAFEREAAAYLNVAHAIGCASGTDALHLSLRALDVGPGDEVITTPFTFFGTVEAILYLGARPVFVDIDEKTYNIDPSQVEAAITPATRAILPVHIFGQPADLEALSALAGRHGVALVEDCAQSFGASRAGRATGTWGTAGGFSFFPSKNLGAYGDGGMVTTHSDTLADRLRQLRNHGSTERYRHGAIGLNSRLDELQAVVLRAKLKRIDRYNGARRRIAQLYTSLLSDLTGVVTPYESAGGVHVYHQYTLLLEQREGVRQALNSRGIASAVHYPVPLHRQPALEHRYGAQRFPVAESVAERCLSLPIYPELSEEQAMTVVEGLRSALTEAA